MDAVIALCLLRQVVTVTTEQIDNMSDVLSSAFSAAKSPEM